MTDKKQPKKIDFAQITLEHKPIYEGYLAREKGRGCEFSFANLYLWGRQKIAEVCGHTVIFSQFDRRSVYPYPLGDGDKRAVLDAIIEDAEARGIPCRITGLDDSARATVEALYPDRFRFHCDEGAFDYVYSIDDLADLAGRKYHSKRNHIARFYEAYPDAVAVPIDEDNTENVREMLEAWYKERTRDNPNADFHMEHAAIEKALRDCESLLMEGVAIMCGGEVLAFSLASRLSEDTFDVHFEKARSDVQGAYAAINREMARYIREKHPSVRYLDREEDMGLEGLRKAKKSYYPHHMVEKYWACLLEDGYDY